MLFKKRVPPPAPRPPKRPLPAPLRDTASVKEVLTSVGATPTSPKVQALIDVKDLSLGDELGEGEFGSVLKGTWKSHSGKLLDVSREFCSVEIEFFHVAVLQLEIIKL